jgi:hypothetical protein
MAARVWFISWNAAVVLASTPLTGHAPASPSGTVPVAPSGLPLDASWAPPASPLLDPLEPEPPLDPLEPLDPAAASPPPEEPELDAAPSRPPLDPEPDPDPELEAPELDALASSPEPEKGSCGELEEQPIPTTAATAGTNAARRSTSGTIRCGMAHALSRLLRLRNALR